MTGIIDVCFEYLAQTILYSTLEGRCTDSLPTTYPAPSNNNSVGSRGWYDSPELHAEAPSLYSLYLCICRPVCSELRTFKVRVAPLSKTMTFLSKAALVSAYLIPSSVIAYPLYLRHAGHLPKPVNYTPWPRLRHYAAEASRKSYQSRVRARTH